MDNENITIKRTTFWETFLSLCEEAGEKPTPLTKKLGLAHASVTRWKNGSVPNGKTLKVIAEHFDVPVGSLLGIDSNIAVEEKSVFWDNYVRLCTKHGLSPNGAAKAVSVSSGSVSAWKNGRQPSGSTIKKLADYFGVSTDYFLRVSEESKKNTDENTISSKKLQRWIDIYMRMNEEQADVLMDFLEKTI